VSDIDELDRVRRMRPLDGLFEQRSVAEADAELSALTRPPKPRIEMPGAGQLARQEARAKVSVTEAQRKIIWALEGSGGLTRTQIAEVTGLCINTVNGRVSELRDATLWHGLPQVVTHGRRGAESVCHLREQVPEAAP